MFIGHWMGGSDVATATATRSRRVGGERRGAVRVKRVVAVRLFEAVSGRVLAGRTLDLSAGGARVRLAAGVELARGTVFTAFLGAGLGGGGGTLTGTRGVRRARVVWARRDAASTRCGLEFLPDIDADLAAA